MTQIKYLRVFVLLSPVLIVGVMEYARYALHPVIESWTGRLLMDGVVVGGAIFFYGIVFNIFSDMQARLEMRNRELEALRNAGLDVVSDLSLELVLQKIVDQARNLIGTRYGAFSVIDEHGRIKAFITSGIGSEERQRIGPPPKGQGLLGVVLREGQRLRLDDLQLDSRSAGFPEHHPDMHTLLAVPVICRSPLRGNLYLAEKDGGDMMTREEEETLARFASHAAVAIDNAHLHSQVRQLAVADERSRLAHEMHDGQAQVLAYVNTKAQAVRAFLERGDTDEAQAQLEQLAAAARQVLADVREGILGLRTAANAEVGLSDAIRYHVELWQDQTGIMTDLEIDDVPRMMPETELQLIRIVQESLSNVRKHARAERAKIHLSRLESGGVRIRVEDDGVGFHPESTIRRQIPRFGLATMRERAEAIGAVLRIESQLDGGTRIEVKHEGFHRPQEETSSLWKDT